MATGASRITGLLEGDDVLATAQALRQLGQPSAIWVTAFGVAVVGRPVLKRLPTRWISAIRVQERAWLWE